MTWPTSSLVVTGPDPLSQWIPFPETATPMESPSSPLPWYHMSHRSSSSRTYRLTTGEPTSWLSQEGAGPTATTKPWQEVEEGSGEERAAEMGCDCCRCPSANEERRLDV